MHASLNSSVPLEAIQIQGALGILGELFQLQYMQICRTQISEVMRHLN